MHQPLYDKRMLELMELKKVEGMLYKDFLHSIGFKDHLNLNRIRNGMHSFTLAQVAKCIDVYKVNPAYFFDRKAKSVILKKDLK